MKRETRLTSGVQPIEIYGVSFIPEAGMDSILELLLGYFKSKKRRNFKASYWVLLIANQTKRPQVSVSWSKSTGASTTPALRWRPIPARPHHWTESDSARPPCGLGLWWRRRVESPWQPFCLRLQFERSVSSDLRDSAVPAAPSERRVRTLRRPSSSMH